MDVVDVIISSQNIVVVIASPHFPPRSAASSKPLPYNCRYVACRDRSWERDVEDSILTASWVINYDADRKVTKT